MQFKPSFLYGLQQLVGLVYGQNLGLLMCRAIERYGEFIVLFVKKHIVIYTGPPIIH